MVSSFTQLAFTGCPPFLQKVFSFSTIFTSSSFLPRVLSIFTTAACPPTFPTNSSIPFLPTLLFPSICTILFLQISSISPHIYFPSTCTIFSSISPHLYLPQLAQFPSYKFHQFLHTFTTLSLQNFLPPDFLNFSKPLFPSTCIISFLRIFSIFHTFISLNLHNLLPTNFLNFSTPLLPSTCTISILQIFSNSLHLYFPQLAQFPSSRFPQILHTFISFSLHNFLPPDFLNFSTPLFTSTCTIACFIFLPFLNNFISFNLHNFLPPELSTHLFHSKCTIFFLQISSICPHLYYAQLAQIASFRYPQFVHTFISLNLHNFLPQDSSFFQTFISLNLHNFLPPDFPTPLFPWSCTISFLWISSILPSIYFHQLAQFASFRFPQFFYFFFNLHNFLPPDFLKFSIPSFPSICTISFLQISSIFHTFYFPQLAQFPSSRFPQFFYTFISLNLHNFHSSIFPQFLHTFISRNLYNSFQGFHFPGP